VGLLKDSTLMGIFPIPPPDIPPPFVTSINMISTNIRETLASYDPWVVPSFGDYLRYGEKMPLSLVESSYQDIQSTTTSLPSLYDSCNTTLFMSCNALIPIYNAPLHSRASATSWNNNIILNYIHMTCI